MKIFFRLFTPLYWAGSICGVLPVDPGLGHRTGDSRAPGTPVRFVRFLCVLRHGLPCLRPVQGTAGSNT
ncbi:MAG: hypothetical protein MZV64_59640 [Ignavibacteriales bacterium]|nr:hypothetical protein [Ignavibacteriales bacterium]